MYKKQWDPRGQLEIGWDEGWWRSWQICHNWKNSSFLFKMCQKFIIFEEAKSINLSTWYLLEKCIVIGTDSSITYRSSSVKQHFICCFLTFIPDNMCLLKTHFEKSIIILCPVPYNIFLGRSSWLSSCITFIECTRNLAT